MKEAYVIKNFGDSKELNEEDLKLINKYTKRNFKKEEIYTFSFILCDNEIDRENEKFTKEALEKLSKLFLGKTGVMDHEAKAKNQSARIYYCEVEKVDGKITKDKDPYFRLKAKAYMPKSEKNKDLILQIDSGIKKEISVGCAVNKVICSICGCNKKNGISCNHIKGRNYNKRLCYNILDDPIDAYEWSFVAIPAQKEAGVIKSLKNRNLKGGVLNLEEILEKINSLKEISLSEEEVKLLADYIKNLEEISNFGKECKEDLKKEVVRLYALNQPKISSEVINSVTSKMSFHELKAFKKAFIKNDNSPLFFDVKPQLANKPCTKTSLYKEFKV